MTRRGGLGRGLDALIPTNPPETGVISGEPPPPGSTPAAPEPPGSPAGPPRPGDDELATRVAELTREVRELRAVVDELLAAISTLAPPELPGPGEPASIAGLVAGARDDVLTLVRVSVELGVGVTRAAIAPALRIVTAARDHLPARLR